MPQLRNPNLTPPTGWRFFEARTGLNIESDNLWSLVDKVIAHRQQRGLQPTERLVVRNEIESQICARLGNECRKSNPEDKWEPVSDVSAAIGASEVLAFTKFLIAWFTQGGGYADKDETLRRRAICSTCPLNNPMKGCSCGPLYSLLAKLVPSDRQFSDLHVCGICGCSLKLKCSSPAEAVIKSDEGRNLKYPNHCWVKGLTSK